uniref:SP-RING-type domain-containing protein n=1 Tax=Globodera pallida TaxID=36090 RepID=A0A183CHA3_GLOPA
MIPSLNSIIISASDLKRSKSTRTTRNRRRRRSSSSSNQSEENGAIYPQRPNSSNRGAVAVPVRLATGPQHRQPHPHQPGLHPQQRPNQKVGAIAGQQQQVQAVAVPIAASQPPSVQQPPTQQPQQSNTSGITAVNSPAEFPKCANDVLSQIGDFVRQWGAQPQHKGWNRTKQKELQKCIDAELFCLSIEPTRRGQCRLNHLQRLRLLGIEVARETDPALRYLHFEIIFCGREGEAHLHEARVQFLVKLCSLAAQYPVYGLFEDVAHWVKSDELKRTYMEQIVAELVEGFVITPAHHRLHEFLLPLADYSMEFCANFVVFAITTESLGPALGELVGNWLSDRIEKFVHLLRQNPHIGQPFCAQKFNLLLRYDSTNSVDDDIHHQLHFVLLKLPMLWRNFEDPKSLSSRPVADCLHEIFSNQLNTLNLLAQQRLVENIVKCYRSAFIHTLEPFRAPFSSLSLPFHAESSRMGSHWAILAAAVSEEHQK